METSPGGEVTSWKVKAGMNSTSAGISASAKQNRVRVTARSVKRVRVTARSVKNLNFTARSVLKECQRVLKVGGEIALRNGLSVINNMELY